MDEDDLRLPYSDHLVYLRGESQVWIARLAEALTDAGIPHHFQGEEHVSRDGHEPTSWSWAVYVDPQDESEARDIDRKVEIEHVGEVVEPVEQADVPSFDEPDAAYSPEEKAAIRRSESVWTAAVALFFLALVLAIVAGRSGSWVWWTACVVAFLAGIEVRRLSIRIRGERGGSPGPMQR